MPHPIHADAGSPDFPIFLTLTLLVAGWLYLRGWLHLRSGAPKLLPFWRAFGYFFGLLLVWTALGSPVAAYDHDLLTVHMIKHLLLMTFAPPLILLGEPIMTFAQAIPTRARNKFAQLAQQPLLRGLVGFVTKPAVCWIVSALTLIAWHLPALFTLGMRSTGWHAVEQATFFAAGLLFWWPVIQPWPSASNAPQWSSLLYLFLATLPCDILSGFLVFSDRVAYPVYFSAPRRFGFSVLDDQQCAAALMWTCVSFVYLVPAAIISTNLLSPRTADHYALAQPQAQDPMTPQGDLDRAEVV